MSSYDRVSDYRKEMPDAANHSAAFARHIEEKKEASSYDRVADYMRQMPDAANHSEAFTRSFVERARSQRVVAADGVALEKEALSRAEREIIRELGAQVKFTKKNFHKGFNLKVFCRAKREGGGYVERNSVKELNFMGSREWFLLPSYADVRYSSRESVLHLMDTAQLAAIQSVCNTLASGEADALAMVATRERLTMPIDMRHMFMKMYLMLMDYNLAATSKCSEMEKVDGLTFTHYPNVTQPARLSLITDHRIVVDADGFTPMELGLLAISAKEYPSVWYAGDNIYTNTNMVEDDLAILSSGELDMDLSLAWGSPDRLLQTMWALACKLDSVECLMTAIRTMRGRCKMASDLFARVDANTIQSMVPLSSNLSRSLGGACLKYVTTSTPGYISTSFSLITDLMYGMMYEASASCVVEELGGIGKALSSSTPDTSRTFNGLLRDHGLEHSDTSVNILLLNWHAISQAPVEWAFGKYLKMYCVSLACEMVQGRDILLPQIMNLLPFTHTPNTAWGLSRNWHGSGDILGQSKKDRKNANNALAAISFIMGIRSTRPRVFRNTYSGSDLALGPEEYQLAAESGKGCSLDEVKFWLADSVGGRVDENEKSADNLFKTEYAGTKCSIVYHEVEEKWVPVSEINYEAMVKQSMHGELPPQEGAPVVRPVTFGGGRAQRTGIFDHLKNLQKNSSVKVDDRKRHIKVTDEGDMMVGAYLADGEAVTSPVKGVMSLIRSDEEVELAMVEPTVPVGKLGGILANLQAYGFSSPQTSDVAEHLFEGDQQLSEEEASFIAEEWGFNLQVVDKNEVRQYTPYGEDKHTVTLIKKGEDYGGGIPKKGGSEKVKVDRIMRVKPSDGGKTRFKGKLGRFIARV